MAAAMAVQRRPAAASHAIGKQRGHAIGKQRAMLLESNRAMLLESSARRLLGTPQFRPNGITPLSIRKVKIFITSCAGCPAAASHAIGTHGCQPCY